MAEGCQQSSAFVYKYVAHVVSLADLIVSMTATTTPCTHTLLLLRIVINTFECSRAVLQVSVHAHCYFLATLTTVLVTILV